MFFHRSEQTKSEDIHSPILDTAVIIKESSRTNQRRAEGWAPDRAFGRKKCTKSKAKWFISCEVTGL
jgi:hypothetical protein